MPSRPEFRDFVLEQMNLLRGVQARGMFGGFGVYAEGRFIALIADDRLFFKVDDATRTLFESRGLRPFEYGPEGDKSTMQYYEAPPEVFDDAEAMREWALRALGAAERAAALRAATSRRSKSRSPRASRRGARRP